MPEKARSVTCSKIPDLVFDADPDPGAIRSLEHHLYEFNVQATGIGQLYGLFLRDEKGLVIGGADGWTWGGTCYIRHLFVPEAMRGKGIGTRLMACIEQEAKVRGCELIVLESHDFQAPEFYCKRGFSVAGSVEGYPRGHRCFTLVKRIVTCQPTTSAMT
jgi:GNAT superfamily N-acetyltransferase